MKIEIDFSAPQENGHYKFIRFKNGKYRFLKTSMLITHEEMAQGNEVVSAGFVDLVDGGFHIRGHSMTLNMGWDTKDSVNFKRIFNRPEISKWDKF